MLRVPGYAIVGPLPVRGNSDLFRAVREADGLPVILKTPSSEAPSGREIERYRREHDLLRRLDGVDGVIRCHGLERSGDMPVLVLDDLGGRALTDPPGEPLAALAFLDLAISLARILEDIHRLGVVHRDLKPGNILVASSGAVQIIDFGSATLQEVEHVDAAPVNLIEGTPGYMSPEQTGRMNRTVDYRTDFYSLGVSFYELLTGVLPFSGKDTLEWFHAHIAQAPRPPHERRPGIPPMLSAIVLKLMAKVAEDRYQSAAGLRADLERCRRDGGEPFPLGRHDVPARFQVPQRLYGREAAVATLLDAFHRVRGTGRMELVLVRGYSGIGKSSVIHELHRPVLERKGFFVGGKFDQLQRDVPYTTIAQAIGELVQHLLAGSDAELAAWRARLQEAWESNGQVLVDLVPRLALVAGEQPPLPELSPAAAQNRLSLVFERFLGVFSEKDRPLVLFLDDLQWADLASLNLVRHLMTQASAGSAVLLLGAYRDNEVDATHPLALLLDDLRKANAEVSEIELGPLSPAHVVQFFADALGAAPGELDSLAGLVHDKTGGNPFFLIQLMLALHQDGLITRSAEGGYRWDEAAIRRKSYSDNVVDFMIGKLRRLPPETQQVLKLAASIGNAFTRKALALVSEESASDLELRALEPVLVLGLVTRAAGDQYRFAHDRIQQAAYALIPEAERPALHLRIGRLLRSTLTPAERREKLFDVVNHLDAGAALIFDSAERHDLARLNAEVGGRAKASAAHHAAISYFETAYELIPGDPWATDRALALEVSLGLATCRLMTGQSEDARRLVDDLLTRGLSRAEKVPVYILKTDILVSQGESPGAVTCILECLRLFGIDMSPHPSFEEVVAAHEEVWAQMGARSIESLLDLPLMTDADMKAAMDVLAVLFAPAYFTDGNLLLLHLCRMVTISLRHGNSPASVHGYGWFGVIVGPVFKKYRAGYAFGKVALDILERYNFAAIRGKALYTMEIIHYWTHPIAISLDLIRRAFHHAVLAGDFQIACYACNHIVSDRLAMGHDLPAVYTETVARLDFVRRAGFRDVADVIWPAQRFTQQMRGLSRSFATLDGDGFTEEAFEAELTPERMVTMRCWYWVLKMQSRYLSGAFAEARAAEARATELIWASISHIQLLDYHLYRPLTLAACHAGATPEEQAAYIEAMRKDREQLDEWACHCPETFRAPERMVAAEIARVTGCFDEAARAYDEAIASARANDFIQNVGLASELAARFWRGRGVSIAADAYARGAHNAYVRWGAHGKARALQEEWTSLAASPPEPRHRSSATTTSYDTGAAVLDALAVVKAQQAISSEIVHDRLVTTLMQVALESAGAQRGALLLRRGEALVVAAVAGEPGGHAARAADESAAHEVPQSLIAYVKRTGEHVLLGDASGVHAFAADPYFAAHAVKAVLCVPLFRKTELCGALYLENNLATGTFTTARIALVEHIASQATISIENARLYAEVQRAEADLRSSNDELERRVEERTRELKQAQAQLVDAARQAGKAEIATNVLHNVGNVLTSVLVNAELMQEEYETSRVGRVGQIASMLQEHRSDLGVFLSQHEGGKLVPDYLTALSAELMAERTRQKDRLEALGKQMVHIRAIVQVQQGDAQSGLVVEECDLRQLLEDALSLQEAAFDRHHVRVVREVADVPPVRTDRHKVVQILINLITNAKIAMASMPEGEKVLRVRLSRAGAQLRIEIADNGVGIAPEHRDKLFNHGFTTRHDGRGFGLHASALAARAIGGTLTLESEGPGRGAAAVLDVPLSTA